LAGTRHSLDARHIRVLPREDQPKAEEGPRCRCLLWERRESRFVDPSTKSETCASGGALGSFDSAGDGQSHHQRIVGLAQDDDSSVSSSAVLHGWGRVRRYASMGGGRGVVQSGMGWSGPGLKPFAVDPGPSGPSRPLRAQVQSEALQCWTGTDHPFRLTNTTSTVVSDPHHRSPASLPG
jgi:hypothetical protein